MPKQQEPMPCFIPVRKIPYSMQIKIFTKASVPTDQNPTEKHTATGWPTYLQKLLWQIILPGPM